MNNLDNQQSTALLETLEKRFHKHMKRHENFSWDFVLTQLNSSPNKLVALYKMEETGGEPDVVSFNTDSKELIFIDCAAETPKGRRSICYDHKALESRKQYKPEDSAINMAEEMGIQLLNEEQYFQLQKVGEFDLKTSSWLLTPDDVRSKGGALFGDKRFGRVFIYHNGADSYYGVRGFRGILIV